VLISRFLFEQSIISLVFFVTYIVFQPPSTIIVRKIGPRIHMAVITILWGGVMIGMGFVKKWDEMAGLRVLLGFLEAGFFPSCVYLLSTWYTRCKFGSSGGGGGGLFTDSGQTRLASVTRSFTWLAALPLPLLVSWPMG
jgi:sugar phosphate permease